MQVKTTNHDILLSSGRLLASDMTDLRKTVSSRLSDLTARHSHKLFVAEVCDAGLGW